MQGNTGQEISDNLDKALEAKFENPYHIVGEAYVLFYEAVKALDAKIYGGTVLLCRATLETAFLVFLTRKWNKGGLMTIDTPKTLDGKPRRVEFAELVSAVKGKVKFSDSQARAIARIHEDGNFIAHFVGRREKELLNASKELASLSKKLSGQGVSMEGQVKAYDKLLKKLRMWIGHGEALEDLRDTASILLTLFSSVTLQ